jgi:putative ABC transport system substrate-binding protein
MNRRTFAGNLARLAFSVAGLGVIGGCGLAIPSQSKPRLRRVGYMSGAAVEAEEAAILDAFRQHGWVEGDNLVLERRFYGGSAQTAANQAAELLRLDMEVLLTGGSTATAAAKAASSTVPIVMVGVGDPVGLGFVSNFGRPGANLTGNAYEAGSIASKQLELLRDISPGVSRIAFLWSPESPGNRSNARAHHEVAPVLGLDEIPAAFEMIMRMKPDALRFLSEEVFNRHKPEWLGFAASQRLPAMYQQLDWVAAGGLMAYLADNLDLFRRGVGYVDRILRGAKPGDLPIEQPNMFEFHVNAATAQALGMRIPTDVAAQVTRWFP